MKKQEYEYEFTQGPIYVSGKMEHGEHNLFLASKNSPMVLADLNPVHTQTPGNARRLAASWNACLKFTTEELEYGLPEKHAEAELMWERLMMQLVGEDGPKSVTEAINKIKAERDKLRTRLMALEDIATAVEADIDAGRPLENNVDELRAELIRARKALGILPEQEQTTTLGMEAST